MIEVRDEEESERTRSKKKEKPVLVDVVRDKEDKDDQIGTFATLKSCLYMHTDLLLSLDLMRELSDSFKL